MNLKYIYKGAVMKTPCLYIVIPCYNEADVLPVTAPLFLDELESLIKTELVGDDSKILFVDDGSKDASWDIIEELSKTNARYCGIRQSRNRGHQNALLAGLMEAKDKCDITITVDCDGQDDIHAMKDMVSEYLSGCEIVYGVRKSRRSDSPFKRFSAQSYYKFMNCLGADVVYNHADYRLVSSKVLNEFSHFEEVNLFLRGMFPLVGFKSTCVYYERQKRVAGKSHYTFGKMSALALDGITSLSNRPIRLISIAGIIVSLLGFIGILWAVIAHFVGHTVAGWTSMICVICFIGGIQLVCTGVLGEYIGKIYMEVKKRPRYIISDRTDNLSENDSK